MSRMRQKIAMILAIVIVSTTVLNVSGVDINPVNVMSYAEVTLGEGEVLIGIFPVGSLSHYRSGNDYHYYSYSKSKDDDIEHIITNVYEDTIYISYREVIISDQVQVIGKLIPDPNNTISWETVTTFLSALGYYSSVIFNADTAGYIDSSYGSGIAKVFFVENYYSLTTDPTAFESQKINLDFVNYDYRIGHDGYFNLDVMKGAFQKWSVLNQNSSFIIRNKFTAPVTLQRRKRFIEHTITPVVNGDYVFTPTEQVQINANITSGFTNNCTIKGYLDSSTSPFFTKSITMAEAKTVTLSGINRSTITEGKHTIKIVISDPNYTHVNLQDIYIQNAPTFGGGSFTHFLSGASVNSVFKFKAYDPYPNTSIAYGYSLNGAPMSGTLYTTNGIENAINLNSLSAATQNTLRVDIVDAGGLLTTNYFTTYTPPHQPTITASGVTNEGALLTIHDANSTQAQYTIMCNGQYVKPDGTLTSTETYLSLPSKTITLRYLNALTNYSVQVKAKNSDPVSPLYTPYSPTVAFSTTTFISPQAGADYIFSYNEDIKVNAYITSQFIGNCTVSAYLDSSTTPFYSRVVGPAEPRTVAITGNNRASLTEGKHIVKIKVVNESYTNESTQEIYAQNLPTISTDRFSHVLNGNTFNSAFKFKALDLYPSTLLSYTYSVNGGANSNAVAITNGAENTIDLGVLNPASKMLFTVNVLDAGGLPSSKTYTTYTPPLQPTVTATSITNEGAVLTLHDVNGPEVQYAIMCNDKFVKADGTLTPVETYISLPSKTLALRFIDFSTNYALKVKAKNNDPVEPQYTGYSGEATFRTLPNNLEPVQNLKTIEVTNNSTLIQWDAVNEAVEYQVVINDGVNTRSFITPLTKYEITGLVGNTQYFVTLQAINSTIHSVPSQPIYFKTTFFVDDLRESDPINLTTGTEVSMTWTPVANAISYQIEADGAVLYDGRETEAGQSEQFWHKGLMPGTTHLYRIRARVASGYGPWSGYIRVTTKAELPQGAPAIQTAESYGTYDTIVLKWSAVRSATEYEVAYLSDTSMGQVFTVKGDPQCILKGLNPNTAYQFQVRGINNLGEGAWSEVIPITTAYLKTPQNITVTESDNVIHIAYEKVEEAAQYKIDLYDQLGMLVLTDTIALLTYKFEGLNPESEYYVKIQALSEKGLSAPSEAITCFTLPKKPLQLDAISAMAFENCIYYHWDQSIDASDNPDLTVQGYDVEVDGVLLENDLENGYLYERLDPYTEHTFRVRAQNGAVEGDWSALKTIKTLPSKPTAPIDVKVKSNSTSIALEWENIPGNQGYDIRVDDGTGFKEYSNVHSEKFIIRKAREQQEYRIQIRTLNVHGKSEWGNLIINNGIKALCQYDKDIELGLAAVDANDLRKYEMIVTYDPKVLTVVDLCSMTGEVELTVGKVKGTNIEITYFEEGLIKFRVEKVLSIDEAWTGVINAIKLSSKHKGGTTITYTVTMTGLPEITQE